MFSAATGSANETVAAHHRFVVGLGEVAVNQITELATSEVELTRHASQHSVANVAIRSMGDQCANRSVLSYESEVFQLQMT